MFSNVEFRKTKLYGAKLQTLNLNSLRIFAAAARHGNFLVASAELHLSQGAVSQRIKQLELDLGLRLFERGPRGVSLTNAGQELARTVETSLGMIAQTVQQIRQSDTEVTLQVSPSIARKWLTPRLPEFSSLYPDVHLKIEASSEVLKRPLLRNEIAMRHGKNFAPVKGQKMRKLVEIDLVAVCSPLLLDVPAKRDLRDVLTLPLIQDTHYRWDKLMTKDTAAVTSKPLHFNSSSLAIDAAINAQGVAIVPSIFVKNEIAEDRLIGIWTDETPSGEYLFLVWPETQLAHQPLNNLVQWIHKAFGHDMAN